MRPVGEDPKDWGPEAEGIRERRRRAAELGGPEAVERQHSLGRLTVRERIDLLLDPESFHELGPIAGHGETDPEGRLESFNPANYVLGIGRIAGRPCVVGGEDFTQRGGSPSPAGLRKSVYAEELACSYRFPLVRLLEGGGGSVPRSGSERPAPAGEPVYATPRFQSIALAMGTVPVVSAALGPVAGLPAARLVASHLSLMTRETAQVLVGGPALVERALGERKTKEELGGFQVHTRNGAVDNLAEDEEDAFRQIRRFLSYLPSNVWESAPLEDPADDPERTEEKLLSIVPRDRRRVYDMRRLLELVLDTDTFFEMAPSSGRSQIVGLARLRGQPVGVLANDPHFYAGAMDARGAEKVRRLVDLCDTFHLPIVSFVDEPGFMIGSAAEQAGTIRYGTAALFAVVQSTVPWASVLVRKAFGVAAGAHFGPGGFVLAWPSAETGALPVEGGVAVAFRREIEAASDPAARRRELEEQLAARRSPFPRAEAFSVHDLIDPRETRPALCRWIEWAAPLIRGRRGPRSYTFRP
jgi:acetyl-CoA carboxylase carboxyltransferase component